MKIALAQMDVVPNRPRKNVDTMLRMIEQAKKQKADLVAFPEMSVGGYLVGDKWTDESFCRNLMEFNKPLREASDGIAIAWGNIFLDDKINERVQDNKPHPNKDGRIRKYNAVYVVQNGKPVARKKETNLLPKGVAPKTLLPTYRFFDDERYFFGAGDIAQDFNVPLEELLQPFEIEVGGQKIPIGFELCEDLWCADYRKDGEALNPTKILIKNGAQRIVNISASPWTYKKNEARDRRVQFLKDDIGEGFVPFFYVNCVGTQNNGKNIITFDGGSTAYGADGQPVAMHLDAYKEDVMVVPGATLREQPKTRAEKPKIAQKADAIIRGMQHLKDIFGADTQPKYVIGLSGGIDSVVVAALAVQAVGKENVMAVNMPTRYNTEKTKQAAQHIAERLGIKYNVIPIETIVEANEKLVAGADLDGTGRALSTLHQENIQAKIRGTSILSNLAAKYSGIFTNNGNKLETALGYATLYGDVGGALAPLGDLTKAEVFDLARYLNDQMFHREVIPETLIPDRLFRFRKDQIQPSAELKEAQVDPMKFGYHCALLEKYMDFKKANAEQIMQWYVDDTLEENLGVTTELLERWGITEPRTFVEDLEWFDKTIHKNVFKRVQAPPNIVTSKTAYGFDLREAQLPYEPTRKQEELKAQILQMELIHNAP